MIMIPSIIPNSFKIGIIFCYIQIDGTLTTIEQQREALEGANTNTAVLTTMGEAAKALKKAHADMDVDQVTIS